MPHPQQVCVETKRKVLACPLVFTAYHVDIVKITDKKEYKVS